MDTAQEAGPGRGRRGLRGVLAAWGVHLFTASGAVMGVLALAALVAGDPAEAALWMLGALAVDSVDGTLARAVGVREILPGLDGRRLDDVVDYLNFVVVAAVFMGATGHLPGWGWAAVPVLAGAYGFAQADAKTEDDFFLGFPSYWNVIALYLWLLDIRPAVGAAVVTGFAVLVFVPWKYIYPSKSPVFRRSTLLASSLWVIALAVASAHRDAAWARPLALATLALPAWYMGLSAVYGGLHRR